MTDFTWKAVPLLSTSRLLLRPLVRSDTSDLFTIYGNKEVMAFASDPPFSDEAALGIMFDHMEQLFAAHSALQWGIVLWASGQIIGTCEIHSISEDGTEAELGCLLAQAYWGQGIMSEALRELITFAFEDLGIRTLLADIDLPNTRSRTLFNRLGFLPVPNTTTYMALARPE